MPPPFLNGQFTSDRNIAYDPAAQSPAPPLNSFLGQIAQGQLPQQQAPAPTSFVNQAQQLPNATVTTTPTLTPLPTIPDYENYITGKSGPSLTTRLADLFSTNNGAAAFTGSTNDYDTAGYHRDRAKYLAARDDRLNSILGALPPAQSAAARDQFALDLAALQSSTPSADGKQKGWHDLTRTEQLAQTSALYDKYESQYKAAFFDPSIAQSSASTNPRLTYTPQEQAAIQAVIGQFIAPYATRANISGAAAGGLFNELAGQTSSPTMAALDRAQGAQYQAGGDALAQAYVQQAQALPAIFALQQNQAFANQISSLQNQLAAQQSQSQQSSAPDLSALLGTGS